jgi:methionine synthase I (cobalamin-dependent)
MTDTEEALRKLLAERILVLDGAMGTMIQSHKLDEAAFRGRRFAKHSHDLRGCNDVLCLTQSDLIAEIHLRYLEAGADIIETNTFNSTSISMADYKLEADVYDINVAGARAAKRAVDAMAAKDSSRRCFVAGAIGPTNRTCSISTDVQSAATRGVTYEELVQAYYDQVRGLVDGGADMLLVETIFDTLNAKAAFFAIATLFDERKLELPLMASVTFIQPGSNRGVTGQTVEAFWNSISHVPLLSVGMNCALGPKEMRPLIEELSQIAPVYISRLTRSAAADRFSGDAAEPGAAVARVGGERLAEHRRWLLRYYAGAHREHCRSRERIAAAGAACTRALSSPERPGERHGSARVQLCQYRRTDQRHRIAGIRQTGVGRRLREGSECCAPTSRGRRADH